MSIQTAFSGNWDASGDGNVGQSGDYLKVGGAKINVIPRD